MPTLYSLEISTWEGMSFGATHYYGEIVYYDTHRQYNRVKLTTVITQVELDDFLKKEPDGYYRLGDTTHRFLTRDRVYGAALAWFLDNRSSPGDVLLSGSHALAQPEIALCGPDEFCLPANVIAHAFIALDDNGGWEKHNAKMRKLSDQWDVLVESNGLGR